MTPEEQDMYVYALRYCLGRLTYAPSTCAEEIQRKIKQLSQKTLFVMVESINQDLVCMSDVYDRPENKHIKQTWLSLKSALENRYIIKKQGSDNSGQFKKNEQSVIN
ncbi:MAG: hypothetical protein E7011_02200 [Alphaproteobacteria bacterium]|nr:hypothetical protein [Alphaproteobacteria bacterium]